MLVNVYVSHAVKKTSNVCGCSHFPVEFCFCLQRFATVGSASMKGILECSEINVLRLLWGPPAKPKVGEKTGLSVCYLVFLFTA